MLINWCKRLSLPTYMMQCMRIVQRPNANYSHTLHKVNCLRTGHLSTAQLSSAKCQGNSPCVAP